MAGAPLRVAAAVALVAGSACRIPGPAPDDLVAALESCRDPADRPRIDAAERALARGDQEDVLAAARAMIPRNPACARLAILARRAVTLADPGDQPALVAEFRTRFTELLRESTDATATASLAFGAALFAGDDGERRKWLHEAIAKQPNHYYALCKEGEDLWLRGELEHAKEVLTKAVALRKDVAEGWLLLARVAEDRGFYKTAGRHYRSYLGLRPLDRRVKESYARLLVHQLHDGAAAEAVVAELWAADPTNVEVGLNRGLAFFLQGRWKEAERAYKDLLGRYPREARVVLSLGNLYLGAMHEPVKALQAYRYFLSLRAAGDVHSILDRALFVPSRVRDIEASLTRLGIQAPHPPAGVEELLGT